MNSQDTEQFRRRARAWLEANAPRSALGHGGSPDDLATPIETQQAFQAALYDAGFAGITWPVEYGGQGLANAEKTAFDEEARDFALPVGAFIVGLGMPGPTLLECGTEAQKLRYLPPMLRGEEIWCQLFSEPGAGSDVAALQSTAVRDGAVWVLNGQKVWTSGAQHSDFGIVLARTSPGVPKHAGITMFVLDMHAPGVTVRPLRVATGEAPFNEVFFDDVRLGTDAVVGAVDGGWSAAVIMLRNERESLGTRSRSRTDPLSYDSLSRLAGRPLRVDRQRLLAQLHARESGVRLLAGLIRDELTRGTDVGARGSIVKLARAELEHFAAEVAFDILDESVAAYESEQVHDVVNAALVARGLSIAGGTNEIQRNIIGERALGLPKDPGFDRRAPFNQLRVGTQTRAAAQAGDSR
jgi:alkylation response protein AidB-like acyl-CoA dehydrogenase